ncbi:CrcB family protein [Bogoriella caseilytica]|uniref:Fluoride-specific ion channel n=1 Tax=Bogoriella caseilytica TaxID=56055 RepID=A0A3N2BGP5_9MICO|nr:CrcB family protein [Bogoriella caseilytica]ROR74254.1 fluoride ion exporter CrcB/FEX [Bogoriella caseilytica]
MIALSGGDLVAIVLAAVAGALGAVMRWSVVSWQAGRRARADRTMVTRVRLIDHAVLAVNCVGSFIAGLAFGAAPILPAVVPLMVAGGLCGGLTTFGTLMVSVADELRNRRPGRAFSALTIQLVLGFLAGVLGLLLGMWFV